VPSVLLVEPADDVAAALERSLRAAGASCRRVEDAESGWRAFAQAPADAVFTAFDTPRRDAAWLLRRLEEEYLGSLPPIYGLITGEAVRFDRRGLDLDGALLVEELPADPAPLLAPRDEEQPAPRAARLGELFEVSLLTGDLETALAIVRERTARAFRVDECLLLRDGSDPGGDVVLAHRCELAADLGTTLITGDRSLLAAPIDVPGGGRLGTLALACARARRFLSEEKHTLRALARRLGVELAWRSAHERLASEHDRMRQTVVLDPLCGILTRGAFEDAVAAQLARRTAADEPVGLAVIDVVQLRQINDRHGHEAGDSALAQLADVVRDALRPADLLGRVGGDELGVLLVDPPPRGPSELLENLVRSVAETRFFHLETSLPVRVRVGVTDVGIDHTPGPPLARAFAALAEARRRGRAVHHVKPSEGSDSLPEMQIAVDTGDSLAPGTTLGGMYQVLHEISRGAMGVVYRAEDLGLRRQVALKVLRPDYASDADAVARFRNEASMLAAVRHEHLVQVYSFGAAQEGVFFVMELVEGESLAEHLARLDEAGEAVPIDLIGRVTTQIAGALDVLHRAGAVHRDVKPANVVLDRVRDRAVLVDVGVARREPGGAEAAGTPGFAAPESFMRSEEGAGTDVYGLAATAYMLLTNLAPFGGGDVSKVLRRQLSEAPAPVSLLRPGLAPAIDAIFARALAPALRERHASAVELAHELSTVIAEHAPERRVTPAPSRPEAPSARGALFRIAYRILGNRLGSAWVRGTAERHPELREVLSPAISPFAWYRVEHLVRLLSQVPPSVRDPLRVARELGRATMTSSFARFYGTEREALAQLSPAAVFDEAPRFWPRLHGWGKLGVETGPNSARVSLSGTPREPLLCCLVEGSLERIAELAGGIGARAWQSSCESQGGAACVFEVRWSESGPLPL
jgi:diguanylate cyclase (GGDEF)-like protein